MCPQQPIAVFAGVVYNYDQDGVHRAGSGWEQCISIPLVQPDMWELLQHWDELLQEFSLEEAWLPHRCVGNSWGVFGMSFGALSEPVVLWDTHSWQPSLDHPQPGLVGQNVLNFK